MSPNLLIGDIEKAFLQIGIKEEDRDAFRFLFTLGGREEHFRFTRVPFGAESSPSILGAILNYHYDQHEEEFKDTTETLRENTYVDNLMKTGHRSEELKQFEKEATEILEKARFPVHKWESNLPELESDDMDNPGKILGHNWGKRKDTLELPVQQFSDEQPVTKRAILSHLGSMYDPLGIISPTTAEGKRIYREACAEKKGWITEVSLMLRNQWLNWTKQLKNITVPRSIAIDLADTKAVHLHVFADACSLACCATTVALVEHESGLIKGLLTSKSRICKRGISIARLELISGHMAANLARNICHAMKRWPVETVTVWMDSMVALYWILNPGKSRKVFVANRVRKMAQITKEVGIQWKYCPTERNFADIGSRGASFKKMENCEWYEGPQWLLRKED